MRHHPVPDGAPDLPVIFGPAEAWEKGLSARTEGAMKKTRFTEERMVTALREGRRQAGAGGRKEAWHERADDLRLAEATSAAWSRATSSACDSWSRRMRG